MQDLEFELKKEAAFFKPEMVKNCCSSFKIAVDLVNEGMITMKKLS